MSDTYQQRPLALWKSGRYWVVSNRADPQHLAKPIGLFPEEQNGELHAKLFKRALEKLRETGVVGI
jgi:hypothetical protein